MGKEEDQRKYLVDLQVADCLILMPCFDQRYINSFLLDKLSIGRVYRNHTGICVLVSDLLDIC